MLITWRHTGRSGVAFRVVAVFLGLLTAVFFGAGDFFGGLSCKRVSVAVVIALAHLIGLVGATIAAVFIAEEFLAIDFLIGAIAGLAGGVGLALLYRGLARGPMAVVAPLTAVTSAAVPAFWGVAGGESFSALAWIGIAIAGVAIVLTSLPSGQLASSRLTGQVIIEALLAGVFFGVLFILFDETSSTTAPWPVVGSRVATAGALLMWLQLARPAELRGIRSTAAQTLPLIALTGLFDTLSNVLFLIATQIGDLTIVAVLSSLYPASTVVLARVVLDEKMTRIQLAGLVAALTATALIAIG